MAYGAEKSDRLENGLTAIANARLEKLATKGKWRNDGKRWDTDSTLEDIEETRNERPLTLKEKALRSLHYDIEHPDARVRRIATGNLKDIESQNLADEHAALKSKHGTDNITELDAAIEAELANAGTGVEASPPAPPPLSE
jgi:hypothetical protein